MSSYHLEIDPLIMAATEGMAALDGTGARKVSRSRQANDRENQSGGCASHQSAAFRRGGSEAEHPAPAAGVTQRVRRIHNSFPALRQSRPRWAPWQRRWRQ